MKNPIHFAPLIGGVCAAALVAQDPPSPTWRDEIHVLRTGESLDLDAVPRVPHPAAAVADAELREVDGALRIAVRHAIDPAMGRILPGLRWTRLETSAGRTAWIAELAPPPLAVVRVLLEPEGGGAAFPPIRGLRTRWTRAAGLTLDFDADDGFARYRIERVDGERVTDLGTCDAPPFVDADLGAGVRASYRVCGEVRSGDRGLPGLTAAVGLAGDPTATGSLHRGRVVLASGQGVDLLTGLVVDEGPADLQSARGELLDAYGLPVRATAFAAGVDFFSAWQGGSAAAARDGARCVVPLRGGGLAVVAAAPVDAGLEVRWVAQPGAAVVSNELFDAARGDRAGLAPAPTVGAPDPAVQEWLLSRIRHQDYEKATFSFEHGIRDDPGLTVTRNDWDLQFGNAHRVDQFNVRMVRDDLSKIADLGRAAAWSEVDVRMAEGAALVLAVPARVGHVYAVHTVDTETDRWALFRVEALSPGDSVRISWVAFDEQELRTSPGVQLERAAEGRLRGLVGWLGERGGLRPFPNEGAAETTVDRLEDARLAEVPGTVGDALALVAATLGTDVALDGRGSARVLEELRGTRLPYAAHLSRVEDTLELATRTIGWWWAVRADGVLVLQPPR